MSNDPQPAEGGSHSGKAPTVSVIMPAFCAIGTLAQSIASVQAQTWQDWELIVIDDASPDATATLAAGFCATDPRIRLVRRPQNGGAGPARNSGITLARGRYIAFLDADDLWLPDKLSRQLEFMQQTGVALCYSAYFQDENGKRSRIKVPARVTRKRLLRGNVIGCLTAIYDSALVGVIEAPPLRMCDDFGLWLRILALAPEARGLPEPLAVYRRQPTSLSVGYRRRLVAIWQLYRQTLGLGRLEAAGYLLAHLGNRILARV